MEKNWQPQTLQDAMTQICLKADFEEAGRKDVERLKKYVTTNSIVLDVGCGIGRVIKQLAPLVKEVYGVDSSEQMLKLASQYLPKLPNATLRLAPAESIPFPDATFDFVYSILTLQHLPKLAVPLAVKEMVRVTKPGGHVLFELANMHHPYHAEQLARAGSSPPGVGPPMQYHNIEEAASLVLLPGVKVESLTAGLQIEVVVMKGAVA